MIQYIIYRTGLYGKSLPVPSLIIFFLLQVFFQGPCPDTHIIFFIYGFNQIVYGFHFITFSYIVRDSGDKYYVDEPIFLPYFSGQFNSVYPRHLDIQQQDIIALIYTPGEVEALPAVKAFDYSLYIFFFSPFLYIFSD